jgi:hypothetical protein
MGPARARTYYAKCSRAFIFRIGTKEKTRLAATHLVVTVNYLPLPPDESSDR